MTTDAKAAPAGRIYSFTMKTIDGKDKPLSDYKGRALLVVNTASLCGFTPQYDSLEELHAKFKDKGLSILAFPANEFGKQEPGDNAEIKEFCRTRFSISFDLFGKIVVKGPGIHPLYRFLTTESGFPGEIGWNFAKFLVDRQGKVVARFGPEDDPAGKKVCGALEALL
ncbi:MAG: glutathione peroxidase [Elusimicrobia bacterium]|nr:glutathione peroxidase [Elusimicrobiota bacterium]